MVDSAQDPVRISGTVEKVTYHHSDTGYCVFRVRIKEKEDPVTIVGYVPSLQAGEGVNIEGVWSNHKDFGPQVKASLIQAKPPESIDEIERYLGSGLLKGVGPATAKKMVQAFGARILEILEEHPEELIGRITGLSRSKIATLAGDWKEQKGMREILSFLQEHGVDASKAARIHRFYGASALRKIRENPYCLARDIHGFGFEASDRIALRLGVDPEAQIRVRAALFHVLGKRMSEGHCAYPERETVSDVMKLLKLSGELHVHEGLEAELAVGDLVREPIEGTDCIFVRDLHDFEEDVARDLKLLKDIPAPNKKFDRQGALARASGALKVELSAEQLQAVEAALDSKVLVITGGPGTGKTTLTRLLVNVLREKGSRIALASPTGRAAKRLAECTGMEARTLHRLLGIRHGQNTMASSTSGNEPDFEFNREHPLSVDFVLVDEVSMVDLPLMRHLLAAIPPHASLVLVGDVDQLPSVGPGAVLASLIQSEAIPVIRLTQVFRQAARSRIISSAHQINRGTMPDLATAPDSDFYWVNSEESDETAAKILEMVRARIPAKFGFDAHRDIQVLTPMNRGPLGTQTLNARLQQVLNPNPAAQVERSGMRFGVGDKVMVVANDYDKEVFNGDIGWITRIDSEQKSLRVDFDGRPIDFEFSELDLLTLAYAVTVHKSQGSEYPAIVMALSLQHYPMLRRNLIYTGVTRGKSLVVMVGQKRALAAALESRDQGKRWTRLAERLRSE